MFERPSWRTGRGWEALLESQKELGHPPGRPGWVRRPSWRARWDQEVRKRMGGPPRGLGGVGKPCHRDRKCREAISEVREWSGVSPGGPEGVARPSQRAGKG